MLELEKVEGTTESFYEFIICQQLHINGVCRQQYPFRFDLLTRPNAAVKQLGAKGWTKKEQNSFIATLGINMTHLLHVSDMIYGKYKWNGKVRELHPKGVDALEYFIKRIPKKYISRELLDIPHGPPGVDNIKMKILKINETAVAYFQSKYPDETKTIKFLRKLVSPVKGGKSFERYIDDWAARLIKETGGKVE